MKKECLKQRPRQVLGDNIATLRSKKLPVVQTEYRGFWESEGGMGCNKKMYVKDSLMFFITDIDGFTHQVLQTFVFGEKCKHVYLRTVIYVIDRGKDLIFRILKNYFKNSAIHQTKQIHITIFFIIFYIYIYIYIYFLCHYFPQI